MAFEVGSEESDELVDAVDRVDGSQLFLVLAQDCQHRVGDAAGFVDGGFDQI